MMHLVGFYYRNGLIALENTITLCVTPQKKADLIYFAAEASNHGSHV
jgi:hypothetical protein